MTAQRDSMEEIFRRLPELVQVPLAEPNSEWKEGYPKYN